jgi:hypothetical protein
MVVALAIAGCGSSESASSEEDRIVMPDVVGKRLDVALSDMERSGIDDEVEVLSDGMFGVVDESNWTVCEQLPEAGQPATEAPRLTVDRSCPDAISEAEVAQPAPTDPLPAPPEPEPAPTQPESAPTEPPTPTEPAAAENITVENNAEFAALLAGDLGSCGDAIDAFAATYRGRNIDFDGNIADWGPHGDYDTRFDFLIYGGDYSMESPVYAGPPMKFEDVNRFDLNLTGDNVPDGVSTGDNFHIVAEIVEFRSIQCLLILDPVSMELR